jgi:hypothetical protein
MFLIAANMYLYLYIAIICVIFVSFICTILYIMVSENRYVILNVVLLIFMLLLIFNIGRVF